MAVSTVPAPVLEILHFEYRELARQKTWKFFKSKRKKCHRSSGIRIHDHRTANPIPSLLCQPSSPLLDAIFCQIYTLYHYNTNPLSLTLPETQTPRNQPIIGTQPPATSLTSCLALSIIIQLYNTLPVLQPLKRKFIGVELLESWSTNGIEIAWIQPSLLGILGISTYLRDIPSKNRMVGSICMLHW